MPKRLLLNRGHLLQWFTGVHLMKIHKQICTHTHTVAHTHIYAHIQSYMHRPTLNIYAYSVNSTRPIYNRPSRHYVRLKDIVKAIAISGRLWTFQSALYYRITAVATAIAATAVYICSCCGLQMFLWLSSNWQLSVKLSLGLQFIHTHARTQAVPADG